jgi:carboxyl-terminal processing protease
VKLFLKTLAVIASFAACSAFGFFWRDIGHRQMPSSTALGRLLGVKVLSSRLSGDQIFIRSYDRILADYVKPIKPLELKYAGIEGMVASLGDLHTIFLPPQAAEEFSDETHANFGGVGAKLGADPLGAKVATVFEDGPAYASGLRKGNLITGVDGVSVAGMEIDAIVERVKGKEGTTVRLTVIRKTKEKPAVISIVRRRIIAPTVEANVIPNTSIGYMVVTQFSEPTAGQFDHALAKLESQGIKGLVIDLRDNPGGLLETAVDMLSRFVDNKVVVSMRFKNGSVETERTSVDDLHPYSYPIAILIDQDSASAAEIFAGCLHDYGKVTLVGTHSYGKASVQNLFPLVDNSSAKITIAHYFLPNGEDIGRKVDADGVKLHGGLTPDVPVELNNQSLVTIGDPASDNQLAKAIAVLKAKM